MNKTVLSGIGLTLISYFLFSLQDASVKWVVVDLAVMQVLFTRSVVIALLCLAVGRGEVIRQSISSPVLVPLFIRNLLLMAAWLAFYTAARDLGLAQLTTLYYASPVLITILAVPILKEQVPPLRWAAVVLGFIGVMVASDVFGTGLSLSLPVMLAFLAACFWAISTVLLRKTAMEEKTIVQMTISNGYFVAICGVACLFLWKQQSALQLAIMVGTGICAGVAQFAMFEGMRRAPVSILAPFEYTSLVWAFILGYMIWGDVPEGHVFAGAGLIFSAGMLILVGERFAGASQNE